MLPIRSAQSLGSGKGHAVNAALAPGRYSDLVRADGVHRALYVDATIFAAERERLFARTWQYVGHASQVPRPGDYITADIAGRPVIMVRRADGQIRVLVNRCAHKGAQIVTDRCGNTGKALRCPYHGWTYRTDGSLLAIPAKADYAASRVDACEAPRGLPAPATAEHRGFVFVRFAADGPSLQDYAAPVLAALDHVADRSPSGCLRVNGACLRSLVRCNWKIYLENVNDTLHVLTTHAPSSQAASAVWSREPEGTPKPMSMEQLLPFASGHEFFAKMGGHVYPNGHSVLGTQQSIHSAYRALADYERTLAAAHGDQRARDVLAFAPQNVILYPSLAFKASPLTLRVLRPLAVDRTLVEVWALEAEGAPELLRQRAASYNRLVFSAFSVVAAEDTHTWESIQRALAADGNDWVSLHRGHRADATEDGDADTSGSDERLMRNQYAAWLRWMT
jgi:phenylpropionate dioxygenase-like ring-hydroxylating dioxygenase large terminal subunit